MQDGMEKTEGAVVDAPFGSQDDFDETVDVLVVGSGSGGFTASITTRHAGLNTLLIESTELIGGCSAMSGGGLWIPNNSLMQEAGVADSYESARTYMDDTIGDAGPASSDARRDAFLTYGPKMVDYLRSLGMRFSYIKGYPDYYPDRVGGMSLGRALESELFNVNELPKEWRNSMRGRLPIAMKTEDAHIIPKPFSRKGMGRIMTIIFKRTIGAALAGKSYAGMGFALVGRLLQIALREGVTIWRNSPLKELIVKDGKVIGALVEKDSKLLKVRALRGVIMTAGGFAHNLEMREKYQQHPITTKWTSANPGDLGEGIKAGIKIGAEIALMDDAWWGPSFIGPNGAAQFMLWERSSSFSIIVDSVGKRYMNESASYVDCGHWMYEHHTEVPCIPSYLVIDKTHRTHYMLGMMPPRMNPKEAFESGFLTKADTLDELAAKIGIDADNLKHTAERFNGFCQTGVDEDFARGNTDYDRYYSDADAAKPNPNLGPIAVPPFYSIQVWPGDLTTKGGLLTDEHARVLTKDNRVIDGLYAAGNNSAAVMGRTYPGPGATIGPAMTFGYIAANHILQSA